MPKEIIKRVVELREIEASLIALINNADADYKAFKKSSEVNLLCAQMNEDVIIHADSELYDVLDEIDSLAILYLCRTGRDIYE